MNYRTIMTLYKKYAVPGHIAAHMRKVADISVFIAKKINAGKSGPVVDIKKLEFAALLHDIVKICDFSPHDKIFKDKRYSSGTKKIWRSLIRKHGKMGHIKAAATILKELNEPKIAEMINKHRYDSIIDNNPSERPSSLEEKILYYADKRVLHDQVVSLEKRLDDGRLRYQNTTGISDKEKEINNAIFKLEKELCSKADITPGQIK